MPAGLTTAPSKKHTQAPPPPTSHPTPVLDSTSPSPKDQEKSVAQPTSIDSTDRIEFDERSGVGDKVEVDENGNECTQTQEHESRPRRTIRQLKNQINKRIIHAKQHFTINKDSENPEAASQNGSSRSKQAKEIALEVGAFVRQRFRSLSRSRRDSYEFTNSTLPGKEPKVEVETEAGGKPRWWQPILVWKEDEAKRQRKLTSVVPDHVDDPAANVSKSNQEALIELELDREMNSYNRTRRQSRFGFSAVSNDGYEGGGGGEDSGSVYSDSTGTPLQTECPGCCIPGPPGPRGPAGIPGKPGIPGPAGKPGTPGTSPNQTCPMQKQRETPPCRPCPKGPPGIKGWPGFPGDPGPLGAHGEKGDDGEDGAPGEPGPQGPPGFKGGPGAPGDKGPTPEGDTREGPPGDPGPIGPVGAPGVPGLPGRNGLTGSQGERGWPGHPGEPGEPGYPGPEGPPGSAGPPGEPGVCVCQNVDSVILMSPNANQPRLPEQTETQYPSYNTEYGGRK